MGSFKVFSEGDEDGLLHEIFSRIGVVNHTFIEIGIGDGLECNTAFLLTQGWNGVWIDSSPDGVNKARTAFSRFSVEVLHEEVTPANVDGLVASKTNGGSLDVLSIDIDSFDYHVWEGVNAVQPRVVVIEYNATLPPHVSQTIPYDPSIRTKVGTFYFGASLSALAKLAERKGYSLVGCSVTGVNAFFVRNDLLKDHFCPPYTATNHYEPARYGLLGQIGHAPFAGEWHDIR